MSRYLKSISALYATDYKRRSKECRQCGTPFCDVTKRNLRSTCTDECSLAAMSDTRHRNGTYVQTEEQKEKKRVSVKATYASRDVFGPELRAKFSETMKKTWEKTRETTNHASVLGNKKTHWLQLSGRSGFKTRARGGKRDDLGGQFFRSSWEANFARVLNFQNRKWLFEPEIFVLETISYTPDFFIPEEQLYVEVKGWMNDRSKQQLQEFSLKYPEKKVQIIGPREYDELKKMYAYLIREWE